MGVSRMSRSPVPITVELPPELLSEIRTGMRGVRFKPSSRTTNYASTWPSSAVLVSRRDVRTGHCTTQMRRASEAAVATRRARKAVSDVAC